MKRRKDPPKLAPKAAPVRTSFQTQSYNVVKQLSAHGITARDCFGQPMMFVYALEDQARIDAVLQSSSV